MTLLVRLVVVVKELLCYLQTARIMALDIQSGSTPFSDRCQISHAEFHDVLGHYSASKYRIVPRAHVSLRINVLTRYLSDRIYGNFRTLINGIYHKDLV